MWLDASVGTDSAGATPINAMSARVSARRGLRAILFIVYSPMKNSGNIVNRTYRTHRACMPYKFYKSYKFYSRFSRINLNKFQSLEQNLFARQQREHGFGRLLGVKPRLSTFAGPSRDRGGV